MANLLPKKERKRFEWEYRLRLLIVILLFFIIVLILGTIFLLPSYFVSESKERSIERQSELLQETITLRKEDASAASLLAIKQKINSLVITQEQVLQTEIIQTIVKNTNKDVTVNALYYTRDGGGSNGEVKITGKANSRASLLSFSDLLKKESLFNRVDLPVSSLARDSDIVFSMTLNGNF